MANFASDCLFIYPVMHMRFLRSCFHSLALTNLYLWLVCCRWSIFYLPLISDCFCISARYCKVITLPLRFFTSQFCMCIHSIINGINNQASEPRTEPLIPVSIPVLALPGNHWSLTLRAVFQVVQHLFCCGFMLTHISVVCLGACHVEYVMTEVKVDAIWCFLFSPL